ncbi:MAG: Lpp/OprI family alanine-zipper lipoprotein [Gammaproteobacteria bacterium]
MKQTGIFVSRVTAISLLVGLMAGCATTSQLEEVRATANNALSEARAAGTKADEALSAANSASSAAQAAQQAADNAQACCNDNADKLDRMFERAMRK